MKTIALIIALLICINGLTQDVKIPRKGNKVYYEAEFPTKGLTKNELYLIFFNRLFELFPPNEKVNIKKDSINEPAATTQLSFFKYTYNLRRYSQLVNFKIEIMVEENKYRIDMHDFYFISKTDSSKLTPIESSYLMVKTKDNFYLKTRKSFESMVHNILNTFLMAKTINMNDIIYECF